MKKNILILTIIMIISIGQLLAFDPVANTDDYNSAMTNPAALGFGNASGFSFEQYFNEDFETDDDYYNLYFNFDNLAYVFQHREDDFHRLALGTDLFTTLYYGVNYDWRNKHFGKGEFGHSLLFRPHNAVSLAAAGKDFLEDDGMAQLGIALRPVFIKGDFWNRFTLSTDVFYSDEDWSDPIVGIQTELLDGFRLGGSYDLDQETIGIDFGISFNKMLVGSKANLDKDNEFAGGSYYVNFSGNTYRSIFDNPKGDKIYDLPLKGEIKEKNQSMKIGPINFSLNKSMTVKQITDKLERLAKDDRVGGIILRQGNFQASTAITTELKVAFDEFKATGKKVMYYSEGISNSNYFFAAAVADEIYLNPAGYIDLRGMSMNLPYFGDLLDTLGVEVVNFRSHPYKTAGNTFSENEITPQERESYEYLLNGIYDEYLVMMEEGRGDKLKKSAQELVDEGPYFIAKRALEQGLVDGLIYEDEIDNKLNELVGSKSIVKGLDNRYVTYDWGKESKEKIAIIYCVGGIHSGKGRDGASIGSVTTAKAIRKARKDKSVKGIILRIDSGGGSALASEVISREVDLCKEGKDAKPVVASMSGVAASGGYYIAAKADKIIAQPATITGSIGVVGMNFNLKGLYDKLHINWSVVKMGENADIGSMNRSMTEAEKEYFREAIEDTYNTFIDRVASGRDLSFEQVHKIAMGRVWTGKQAYDRGLVDELGGLDLAIDVMKDLAEIDKEVQLVEYKGSNSTGFNISVDEDVNLGMNLPSELKQLTEKVNLFQKLDDEKILMVLPYNPEIK